MDSVSQQSDKTLHKFIRVIPFLGGGGGGGEGSGKKGAGDARATRKKGESALI
jgi:hypothetical protein